MSIPKKEEPFCENTEKEFCDDGYTIINNCDYDLLYDMIKNGDVIKEGKK